MSQAALEIENLSVTLDDTPVLRDISLAAASGEMLVLAGPSGSGKSTLLRAIAGLTEYRGAIRLNGRQIDTLAPGKRGVAMVFQDHALMPHMNVRENLAFGLRARGTPRVQAHRKAEDMAASLGLEALCERRPAELSGGERQRVALGRALLRDAPLILLDEPLSSLDGPLRNRLRAEIVAIHERVESTIVHVTHDQTDALGMADRIAVLHEGRLLQAAAPQTIYREPDNQFVASFFGQPEINLVPHAEFPELCPQPELAEGALLGFRPEHVRVAGSRWNPASGSAVSLRGELHRREPLGDVQILHLDCRGQLLRVRLEPDFSCQTGDEIRFDVPADHLLAFDAGSGKRL